MQSVGVGGGSGLGLAKAVAIRMTNPGSILDYEGTGRAVSQPAPLIAVPTTAGSGSEVSNALVLHEAGREREVIVRGAGYEPRVALLDAQLLLELPRNPMLFAALDALTHAFEALWVQRRSIITDALAEKAASTILAHLPAALEHRTEGALQALLESSTAANMACGNTGLGLVHAISSAPTVSLPHGYQNGALLLAIAQFNRREMSGSHLALLDLVPGMFDAVGWPGGFAAGDLTEDDVEAMVIASAGHVFRANNVRPSTDDDVRRLVGTATSLR